MQKSPEHASTEGMGVQLLWAPSRRPPGAHLPLPRETTKCTALFYGFATSAWQATCPCLNSAQLRSVLQSWYVFVPIILTCVSFAAVGFQVRVSHETLATTYLMYQIINFRLTFVATATPAITLSLWATLKAASDATSDLQSSLDGDSVERAFTSAKRVTLLEYACWVPTVIIIYLSLQPNANHSGQNNKANISWLIPMYPPVILFLLRMLRYGTVHRKGELTQQYVTSLGPSVLAVFVLQLFYVLQLAARLLLMPTPVLFWYSYNIAATEEAADVICNSINASYIAQQCEPIWLRFFTWPQHRCQQQQVPVDGYSSAYAACWGTQHLLEAYHLGTVIFGNLSVLLAFVFFLCIKALDGRINLMAGHDESGALQPWYRLGTPSLPHPQARLIKLAVILALCEVSILPFVYGVGLLPSSVQLAKFTGAFDVYIILRNVIIGVWIAAYLCLCIALLTSKLRQRGRLVVWCDGEPVELRTFLVNMLRQELGGADLASHMPKTKFSDSTVSKLITGHPFEAALGIIHLMRASPAKVRAGMADGIREIENEFETFCSQMRAEAASSLQRAWMRILFQRSKKLSAMSGVRLVHALLAKRRPWWAKHRLAEEALECCRYCLHQAAGSSTKLFSNSPYPRDCDADGVRTDRATASGLGMRLADFCALQESTQAGLEPAHVAVIRIYSTAAFKVMNGPLRNPCDSHPLPVTMAFLNDALGKLRAVEGMDASAANAKKDLWRGMGDLEVTSEFMKLGGTEKAPMSTTTDPRVAIQYSKGKTHHSLLFKLHTSSFMERGASIQKFSAFPGEAEILFVRYQPQTQMCAH